MTILYQTQFGVELYGFKERRLVYNDTTEDQDAEYKRLQAEQDEAIAAAEEEEKKKKKKTKEEEDIEELQGNVVGRISFVDSAFTRNAERQRETVDRFIQELPVDINPAEISKAKEEIEREYAEKEMLFNGMQKEIAAFVTASGKTGEEAKKFEDAIGMEVFNLMPLFNLKEMKIQKNYPAKIAPERIVHPLSLQLNRVISMHMKEGEKVDMKSVKELAGRLAEYVPKFVENERNVISRLDLLKQAVIGIHENLTRKQTEKRMIANAERYLGFPLKEGVELQGLNIKWVRNEEGEGDTFRRRKKKWVVMKPEIEKTVRKEGEAKVILKNVVVKLRDASTGEVVAEPLNNMRNFIYAHDITPVVKNQIDLYDKVDYLSGMGIKLKPGDELEFDVMTRDEKSLETFAQANKVKILSIDNKTVKFDKEVLYRAKWDSPDLANHEYKSEMTLGEFSRWLNVRHALPSMSSEELNTKMKEHYNYLNKTYSRNKNCHRPINLIVGEIIYADAPGMPLYKITNVQPDKIEISYGKAKKNFTNTQFARWIYENDLEPYDPALQAERAKTYLKFSDNEAQQVEKDAKDIIEMFENKGFWRDSYGELKNWRAGKVKKKGSVVQMIEPVDVHQQSHSALAEFWRETTFLSFDDIFKLFKQFKDFYHHNWERKQKEKYSSVGKGMPFYGSDFERLNVEAESEEVEHLKKGMKDWSPAKIHEELLEAETKDKLKACIELLCEKGVFRWDDPKMWEKINEFNSPELQIPIPEPEGMDPFQPYKKGTGLRFKGNDITGKTGFDFLPEAIDGLWGESVFTGWKRNNENTYDEGCNKAYKKASELDADPKGTGGVARELAILLEKHMNNIYFEPTDYEGLLRYIIEMGKCGGEDKMYYLLMGLTVPNESGRTILSWDRLSFFTDKYVGQFPPLQYFSDSDIKRLPDTGELYKGPFRKSHFEGMTREWAKQAKETNYGPPSTVNKFLFNEVLSADATQTRIEKAMGSGASKIDHDDWPYIGPAAKENAIENLCQFQSGGTQKISTQAYKNIYVGFAPRIKALVDKIKDENARKERGENSFAGSYQLKLLTTLTAYMRYDSILNQRYKRGAGVFNLSRHDLNTTLSWDPENKLSTYKDNLNKLLKEVINKYYSEGIETDPNRKRNFELAFKELPSTKSDVALQKEQKRIETAVDNFGKDFEDMVAKDNGAKLIEVIEKYEFTQPKAGQTSEEKIQNRMKAYLSDMEGGQSPAAQQGEDMAA